MKLHESPVLRSPELLSSRTSAKISRAFSHCPAATQTAMTELCVITFGGTPAADISRKIATASSEEATVAVAAPASPPLSLPLLPLLLLLPRAEMAVVKLMTSGLSPT